MCIFFFKWELRWNCIQLSDIVHTSMVFMTLAFVTGKMVAAQLSCIISWLVWASVGEDYSHGCWRRLIFSRTSSTVYIYSLYMRCSVAVGRTQDALFKHLSLDFITSPQDYQNNLDTDIKSLAFFSAILFINRVFSFPKMNSTVDRH